MVKHQIFLKGRKTYPVGSSRFLLLNVLAKKKPQQLWMDKVLRKKTIQIGLNLFKKKERIKNRYKWFQSKSFEWSLDDFVVFTWRCLVNKKINLNTWLLDVSKWGSFLDFGMNKNRKPERWINDKGKWKSAKNKIGTIFSEDLFIRLPRTSFHSFSLV